MLHKYANKMHQSIARVYLYSSSYALDNLIKRYSYHPVAISFFLSSVKNSIRNNPPENEKPGSFNETKVLSYFENFLSKNSLEYHPLDEDEILPIFYTHELGRDLGIELISYGRVRPETAELLIDLNDSQVAAVLDLGNQIQERFLRLEKEGIENNLSPMPDAMPSSDKIVQGEI